MTSGADEFAVTLLIRRPKNSTVVHPRDWDWNQLVNADAEGGGMIAEDSPRFTPVIMLGCVKLPIPKGRKN